MPSLLRRSILLLLGLWPIGSLADDSPAPPERIDDRGIGGSLVIVGGGQIPDEVARVFRKLAGPVGKLVVIPTASESADSGPDSERIGTWNARGFEDVTVLHTRDRAKADDPSFVAPIADASAVWFGGGDQSRIAEAYLGTAVERAVSELLRRGGVVGGTSAGAAIQSRLMITAGNPEATTGLGFDLLPDAVVDQHFVARDRKPRLLGVIEEHPDRFGLGIDEGTAVVVFGRSMTVVGESTATILLPSSGARAAAEIVLKPGEQADLTALRRAVRDRNAPPFPPPTMAPPFVEHGTLVIVGGGALPDAIIDRFVALAGGAGARIVVVPTAAGGPIPEDSGQVPGVRMLQEHGAGRVDVLYGRDPEEIQTPEQLATLREATGIWFGGGRQWRFVDAYEGTAIVDLFRGVLRRGGVIGGSSAGATIQGDYLVRGNPLGNPT